MTRYGFVIDVTRCNGCYNCFLACKDEYCGNDFPPYSVSQPMVGHYWMRLIEKERGQYPRVKVAYIAVPCMHCENASCLKMAQDGAIYRRPDGIILIDSEKAAGRKELVASCPYNAIYWNEEKQVPQKCTLCAHLLDQGWKEPRCVEACPTGALLFGNIDDPQSEIAKVLATDDPEPLHPEYQLNEKVKYIGLPRRFVAGSVVFSDTDACAEGVKVTLVGKGEKKTVLTNNFGDFEFEGLPLDQEYTVKIEAKGYKARQFQVKTNIDVYMGDIFLNKTSARQASSRK